MLISLPILYAVSSSLVCFWLGPAQVRQWKQQLSIWIIVSVSSQRIYEVLLQVIWFYLLVQRRKTEEETCWRSSDLLHRRRSIELIKNVSKINGFPCWTHTHTLTGAKCSTDTHLNTRRHTLKAFNSRPAVPSVSTVQSRGWKRATANGPINNMRGPYQSVRRVGWLLGRDRWREVQGEAGRSQQMERRNPAPRRAEPGRRRNAERSRWLCVISTCSPGWLLEWSNRGN